MNIRQTADEADYAACARIMCQSEPWLTLQRDFEACMGAFGGDFREVYVAKSEDGTLKGFVVLQMQGTFRGYLQTIAVAPDARGTGLGTALLHFAEDRIFRVSPNVFLCVSDFNTGALRLYERMGYERIGEIPDFLVSGRAEMLLRKTISPLTDFRPHQETA